MAQDDHGLRVRRLVKTKNSLESSSSHHDSIDGIHEFAVAVIFIRRLVLHEPIQISVEPGNESVETGCDEDAVGDQATRRVRAAPGFSGAAGIGSQARCREPGAPP